MSASWDRYFLGMAKYVGERSKDRSTRIGCVIVGPDNEIRSTGYNGFPRGLNEALESRHKRPEKYLWTEHAERNAIYNAARMGTALKNCRAYVSSSFVCMDCARGLVQSGITEVICEAYDVAKHGDLQKRWEADVARARILFAETRVAMRAPKQSMKLEVFDDILS
jgi:dCMP deaminase